MNSLHHPRFAPFVATLILFAWGSPAWAVSPDQADDFQDGTTLGWDGNTLGTVENIAGGGPTGPGDGYLEISVTGFHLGTKNEVQWTGDYLAAGVEAIEMDLNRLAASVDEVTVRILLFGPGGAFASEQLTPPVPTNTWAHYAFGLSSQDLVHLQDGTGVLNDTLKAVTHLLIRHDRPQPTLPGRHPPHVRATLGIDNVRALPRRPLITGFQATGGVASINIESLPTGTSGVVEESDASLAVWNKRIDFTAGGTTTNLSLPILGETGSLRVRIP